MNVIVIKNVDTMEFQHGKYYVLYHKDLEKRGGCGVVARERHQSRVSE